MTKRTAYFTIGILGALVTAWTLILALAKLKAGAMSALDLGIYTQVAWHTAHGQWFGLTIHPHLYLGDHVELLFALAAIPFRIGAGPLTLIGLQCLAVVGAAFAFFHFSRRYISTALACGAAAIFLLNPFTLNALAFEFHAVLFGLPFAFLAATAYVDKNLGKFWLWSGIMLLAREDLALLLAGFAVLGLLEKRNRNWWLWPGLAAVGWFVGAGILAGAINGEGYKFLNLFRPSTVTAGTVGSGLLGILQLGNFLVLAALLLSVLALPLRAWRWLVLLVLPLIGIGLAGAGSGDLVLQTHYATFFLPGLFCGAVVGWKKLWEKPPGWLRRLGNHALPFAELLLGVVSLYSLLTFGPTVSAVWAWRNVSPAEHYKTRELVRTVIEYSPRDASILAGYSALPEVVNRPQAYAAHYAFLGKRQFSQREYPVPDTLDMVVMDAQDFVTYQLQYGEGKHQTDYETGATRFQELLTKRSLHLTNTFDTLLHFTRYDGPDKLAELVTRAPRAPLSGVEFSLQSASPTITIDPNTQLAKLELIGQVGNPTLANVQVRLRWFDTQGRVIETRLLPLGYGLIPTSSWQLHEAVTTIFTLLPPKKAVRAEVEAIVPHGHLQLNGWRAAEPVLDAKTQVVSQIISLPFGQVTTSGE
ncbi:MAG: DUF2079 domain-containing protein [Patescibacteria group bacterium]